MKKEPNPEPSAERLVESAQRLFDLPAGVEFLHSIGATAVTVWTIRRLISTGKLPCIRLGRKIFVSKAALDDMLARLERRSR